MRTSRVRFVRGGGETRVRFVLGGVRGVRFVPEAAHLAEGVVVRGEERAAAEPQQLPEHLRATRHPVKRLDKATETETDRKECKVADRVGDGVPVEGGGPAPELVDDDEAAEAPRVGAGGWCVRERERERESEREREREREKRERERASEREREERERGGSVCLPLWYGKGDACGERRRGRK